MLGGLRRPVHPAAARARCSTSPAKLGGELLELCRADAPREELFGALLRQVSEPGELHVLVVEDIHWADEATIDLLRFLGRRIRDATGAAHRHLPGRGPERRATRSASPWATWPPSGRSGGSASPPLSADAVAVLAGGSGLDAAALYRLTGGNPFYVSQVVQAGMDEVPASARDAVLARAARLGAGARAVLDAAALIGTRVEFALLESVTGCPPSAVDELLGVRAARRGRRRRCRFRHEIARLAVAGAIPAHRARPPSTPGSWRRCRPLGCDDDARMAFHAEGGRGWPGGAALRARGRPPGRRAGLAP